MASDRKGEKTNKSKSSRRSKTSDTSPKRSRTRLSPPRSSTMSKSIEIYNEAIDDTQWEFTDYKDEAAGLVKNDPNKLVREKVGEATPFLAESKQKMAVRGEHLKEKPMYTLFFLFVEMIILLVALISWSCHTSLNETTPVILCIANLIVLLTVTLAIFSVEFARLNVVEEKLDGAVRFRIPYEWRYWMCWAHLLRFFLICSNLTIGAMDNEFDGGSFTLLGTMPIVLIMLVGHIAFSLKPG